jgi:translation initiation factor IF-3
VTIRFRGREITYPEIALNDLKEVAEELADVGVVEQKPNMEGRVMTMLIAPLKEVKKKTPSKSENKPKQESPAK